ncbi:MAG: hypothetical protein CM15mP115_22890 [Alphaproteobacteria bacterium]|nr:MAG: hypothetical protein CM15mP115_22890 [Alphaproteobacteria bacterium]
MRTDDELAAMRGEAGADIRLNPLKISNRHKLRDKLAGRGMAGHLTKLSPLGIRMTKRVRTDDTQEFRNGLFEIQDEASQIAALLCDARPGMQVADICAGAAGKSLVMAAAMENRGRIVALDTDPERLERGAVRIRRAGIHNIERVAVSGDWGVKRYRGKFDRVVIDAPCTGSGTWRRAVDARWRCDEAGLGESAAGSRRRFLTVAGPWSRRAGASSISPARSCTARARRRSNASWPRRRSWKSRKLPISGRM